MKILIMNLTFNNSINMIKMNKLMDKFNIILFMILILVIYMIIFILKNKIMLKNMIENQMLEFIWTILPMMIILFISYSSITILYLNNEMMLNTMNIKIIANQWFWFYNYMNFNINFNSYMIMKNKFNFNIIETDNKLILPINMQILLIISSMDVIHSWMIPSLNIKIDAIPNQINSNTIMINKINIIFGQCAEICGINHSFMPIMIESINFYNFIKWLKNKLIY